MIFRPDPSIWDGCYANNAWLQELPKPFTKLTWDNAIGLGLATAASLGKGGPLVDGDVVRLTVDGRTVEGPVVVVPGQGRGRGHAVARLWPYPRRPRSHRRR